MMREKTKTARTYGTGSLRVKGTKYYGRWYDEQGQRVERVVGPVRTPHDSDGLTQAAAEKRLRELMGETPVGVSERLTISEAAERFVTRCEMMGRKTSTIRSYRTIIDSRISPRLGAKPFAKLTTEDVERFQSDLLKGGWRRADGTKATPIEPKSVINTIGVLSATCQHGLKKGWIATNPCLAAEKPKVGHSDDIHFLDSGEVAKLLTCVPVERNGYRRRALYVAAIQSGLRQGELLALRWRDVDFGAQRVRVSRAYSSHAHEITTPKSGKGRSVPLSDKLAAMLQEVRESARFKTEDDLVFGNPVTGEPMHGHAVLKQFKVDLGYAGLREIRFHDLRHTFGTTMAGAGVPLRTIQEWMGHAHISTTMIYAAYSPSEQEVEMVNGAFA